MNIMDIIVAKKLSGGGGGTGTSNYNDLSNKPSINGTTLSGNKTAANLGLQAEITGDVTISSDNVDDTNATNLFVTSSEKSTWSGKQDALTFDDSPTESSNNPVKSGGVYTALSGKQAAITNDNKLNPAYIDYNSTYAAVSATEKTSWDGKATSGDITSAIEALDVTGASNIAASKTISAWSETDGKVSVSTQDIAITGSQAVLTGYAKTTGDVAATDTVTAAIGKLETKADTNENNILNIISYINSTKNLFTNTATSGSDGTLSWVVNSDKTVTLTGTTPTNNYRIEIGTFTFENGKKYILSGCPENGSSSTYRLYGANPNDTRVFDFGAGSDVITGDGTEYTFYIYVNDVNTDMTGKIYKPMICFEAAWNVSHEYAPKV